jgi:hypothetical protein
MPNHVRNIIRASDSSALKSLLNDDNEIDFNMWVPMPECLKDFNPSSDIIQAAEIRLGIDRFVHPKTLERINNMDAKRRTEVDRAVANREACGVMYWYDWAWDAWGTKWNAYDQAVTEDALYFDTAWSHPESIIREMSKANPEVTFYLEYADEDLGNNCGTYSIKAGEAFDLDLAPETQDEAEADHWKRFAFSLRYPGEDFDEYQEELAAES